MTRVSDDDAGKNGVFSLTLLNNNGTFEISPNVAERRANFVIRVRDNQMLDYEQFQDLNFQVMTPAPSNRSRFPLTKFLFPDFGAGTGSRHKPVGYR